MKLRTLTFLILLLPVMTSQAKTLEDLIFKDSYFSWGAKIGFAATGTYVTDAYIDGHEITEYTQDSQVGNFAAILVRLNSGRLLVQSGVELSHNKSTFILDMNSWDETSETRDEISGTYTMESLLVPIQVGFNLVNLPPYCMSIYIGPRLRFTPDRYYSVQYTGMEPYVFTDMPVNMVLGWTLGMSVQIGRSFLDFEYETTLNHISGKMEETSGATPVPDYRTDRRMGIMSFSIGIMF